MYNVRLRISVCIARYIILYTVYICIKYRRLYTYNKFIVQYSYTLQCVFTNFVQCVVLLLYNAAV